MMTTIRRYSCPLSDCAWFHDDPGPDPFTMVHPVSADFDPLAPVEDNINAYIRAVCIEHAAETNEVVRKHLADDHELIEWVRALNQARGETRAARQRPTDQRLPLPNDGPAIGLLVIADIGTRMEHGVQTYGVPLQPHNGRDALKDAYDEAVDLALYLRQAIEERDNPKPAAASSQ